MSPWKNPQRVNNLRTQRRTQKHTKKGPTGRRAKKAGKKKTAEENT